MSAVQNKELSEYIIKYFEEGFNIHEVFKNTNQYFTKSAGEPISNSVILDNCSVCKTKVLG